MKDRDRKSAGQIEKTEQIKKRAYEKPVLVLLSDMTAVESKFYNNPETTTTFGTQVGPS